MYNTIHQVFLAVLIFLLFSLPIQAQEATPEVTEPSPEVTEAPPLPEINSPVKVILEADNEVPLLGERFELTVTITAPGNAEILSWPEFPEDEALEVLEIGEIEASILEDTITYTRIYQVILWETGDYLSPEMLVPYQLNGPTSSTVVRSFAVLVPSQVDNPESAAPKPAVAPIDLPYIPPWVYAGIIAMIVLVLMLISRLLQLSKTQVSQLIATTPTQKTIAQLEDLKLQGLPPATIYQLVADNLRQYLQIQFEINAIEMTTAELINALSDNPTLSKEQKQRLKLVLEQADLVKFARFQPDDVASTRLVNFAIKWLREAGRQGLG
jgi:hypothetical protein